MSEENNNTQTSTEENSVTNTSTQADTKNVPYNRFAEVNQQKNDLVGQVGALQAQIDKMNSTQKDKAEAKLVQDGKLKEALDIITKERDAFKVKAEDWDKFQLDRREQLMSHLTTDQDRSIAEGLSDLTKLESYVAKVVNTNAPSTSSARAMTNANQTVDYAELSEADKRSNWSSIVNSFNKKH